VSEKMIKINGKCYRQLLLKTGISAENAPCSKHRISAENAACSKHRISAENAACSKHRCLSEAVGMPSFRFRNRRNLCVVWVIKKLVQGLLLLLSLHMTVLFNLI
jgi:hypothetical protein